MLNGVEYLITQDNTILMVFQASISWVIITEENK